MEEIALFLLSEQDLSSSMGAVKGFVLLAIVLLVPTMGYFQKQQFESRMQPRLRDAAMEVLREEGVEAPEVRMSYLDAVIGGKVASEEKRLAVATRVGALRGVRVPPAANELRTYGWIRHSRTNGSYRAEGILPPDLAVELPPSLKPQSGWDAAIERSAKVEAPRGALEWGEFLSYYFKEPGNRSVELRQDALIMRGDATVGLRGDWLSKASEVVAKNEVVDGFTLHPSTLHFPGYQPVSLQDETRLEQLRRELAAAPAQFSFEDAPGDGSEVPEGEREKVRTAARVMIEAGKDVRYVVGGHPRRDGNVTANGQLANRRALSVVRLLVEEGVARKQLEVVTHGVTPEGDWEDRVEIVVK